MWEIYGPQTLYWMEYKVSYLNLHSSVSMGSQKPKIKELKEVGKRGKPPKII